MAYSAIYLVIIWDNLSLLYYGFLGHSSLRVMWGMKKFMCSVFVNFICSYLLGFCVYFGKFCLPASFPGSLHLMVVVYESIHQSVHSFPPPCIPASLYPLHHPASIITLPPFITRASLHSLSCLITTCDDWWIFCLSSAYFDLVRLERGLE